MMFDFFRKRTAKELIEQANETYGLPEPVKVPIMPKYQEPANQEPYRVGLTNDNKTTLTLLGDGYDVTLTMNQEGCEKLIKMLQSTFN